MPQCNDFDWHSKPQIQRDERPSLLRLLISSYGLAATVAVVAAFAGAGFWASLLIFWLGGAAAVFALGLISIGRGIAIWSINPKATPIGTLEHFDQMLNLLGFPLAWFCDSSFSGGSADAHAAFARHSPSLSSLH